MLARRGIKAIGYIDDFLLISESLESCTFALDCIVKLVESLCLTVNWDKVARPSQNMVFLGMEIDCVARTLALPPDKLEAAKLLVSSWVGKKKATKRSIQQLVGKLNWCSRVMVGGRTFLRSLIDLLVKVSKPHHYVHLGAAARFDIDWWVVGLEIFHGFAPFPADVPIPSSSFSTDACLEGGGGAFSMGTGFMLIGFLMFRQWLVTILICLSCSLY
jgi:hypothetical protein